MFYLLLAVLSSAMIAVVMRLCSGKVAANNTMLAANYLVCLILAGIYGEFQVLPVNEAGFGAAVAMGAVNGALYLMGFVLLQVSIRKNGVVLSSVFMKLGLLVPIFLSLVVFHEIPSALQAVGFLLAVGAIVLINYEKNAVSLGAG